MTENIGGGRWPNFSVTAIEIVAEALVPGYRTTDPDSAHRARAAAIKLLTYSREIAALNQHQSSSDGPRKEPT